MTDTQTRSDARIRHTGYIKASADHTHDLLRDLRDKTGLGGNILASDNLPGVLDVLAFEEGTIDALRERHAKLAAWLEAHDGGYIGYEVWEGSVPEGAFDSSPPASSDVETAAERGRNGSADS